MNSETIPYIVVPPQLLTKAGVKLGDFAVVLNTKNQKLCYAIVADLGPSNRIGEGSIALANAIGVPLGGGAHPVNGSAPRMISRYSRLARMAQKSRRNQRRGRTTPALGRPTTFIKRRAGRLNLRSLSKEKKQERRSGGCPIKVRKISLARLPWLAPRRSLLFGKAISCGCIFSSGMRAWSWCVEARSD